MSKGGKAPKPDPAIGRAAEKQADIAQQWLDFSHEQYNNWLPQWQEYNKQASAMNKIAQQQAQNQLDWSNEQHNRYETVFQPVEDQFVQQASNYDTPAKQEEAAAEANSDVMNAAANAQASNERNMASMGVNPASGRYAGINRATQLNTAIAAGGAENTARQNIRDKGLALKADVANMGKGLPSQAMAMSNSGLGAYGQGLNALGSSMQQFGQGTNLMGAGYNGAMQGYGNQANTLLGQYGAQMQHWQAQQQAGWAPWNFGSQLLGMGAGMAIGLA